ncbi:MAG: hypothetical protein V4558_05515 [Gemmatimonadota bacterium]
MRHSLFAVALLVSACSGEKKPVSNTVTDSAGVRIVTSTSPAWGDKAEWQLDTSAVLSIGEATGPNHVLLVEVNGVRLLSNGGIAVASGGEKSVLFFDKRGVEVGRTGRAGSGPGEFRSVHLVGTSSDSLLIWDAQLDRATLISPDGKVVRRFALARRDTSAATRFGFVPAGIFGDGTLLLSGRSGAATGDKSGWRRDTIPLRRASALGTIGAPIVTVPGSEALAVISKKFVSIIERPFGNRTVIATRGTSTLVGTGNIDGVMVYDSIGRMVSSYRVDRARRLIPQSDLAALGFQQGEQLRQLPPDFANELRRLYSEIGVPATLPATYQMVVDATGAIWLRDDVGPIMRDSIPPRWTVLDAEGRWLGAITLPRRFELHQITADRVVGVIRDENDVEYVRVYRLKR